MADSIVFLVRKYRVGVFRFCTTGCDEVSGSRIDIHADCFYDAFAVHESCTG